MNYNRGVSARRAPYFSFSHANTISRNAVYAIFGGSLVVELFMFGLAGHLTSGMQPGWWMLLCIIPAFGGIFLASLDFAIISLIGGVACAVGLGAFSGPELATYKVGSIVNVAAYTAGITICMTVASSVFRSWVAGIGGALFGALTMLVFSDFVALFMALMGFNVAPALTFLDCVSVVLFSVYIMYDMYRLEEGPATADHAVDMSVHVFLDIINLFMSLLRLIGEKDD